MWDRYEDVPSGPDRGFITWIDDKNMDPVPKRDSTTVLVLQDYDLALLKMRIQ